MSRADIYQKLQNRAKELQKNRKDLAKQLSDATALNQKTGVPSKEHLDRLKEAVASHDKHIQEVSDAIKEIERQAGGGSPEA